jgi:hypothetical protein
MAQVSQQQQQQQWQPHTLVHMPPLLGLSGMQGLNAASCALPYPLPGGMLLPPPLFPTSPGAAPMPLDPAAFLPTHWAFAPPPLQPAPSFAGPGRALCDGEIQAALDTGLDMRAARAALAALYDADAFDLLLDAWRGDSARARDAVRAWRAHIAGAGAFCCRRKGRGGARDVLQRGARRRLTVTRAHASTCT